MACKLLLLALTLLSCVSAQFWQNLEWPEFSDEWKAATDWGHTDLWVGVSMGVYDELQKANDGESCFSRSFSAMFTLLEMSKSFDSPDPFLTNKYEVYELIRRSLVLYRNSVDILGICMRQYRYAKYLEQKSEQAEQEKISPPVDSAEPQEEPLDAQVADNQSTNSTNIDNSTQTESTQEAGEASNTLGSELTDESIDSPPSQELFFLTEKVASTSLSGLVDNLNRWVDFLVGDQAHRKFLFMDAQKTLWFVILSDLFWLQVLVPQQSSAQKMRPLLGQSDQGDTQEIEEDSEPTGEDQQPQGIADAVVPQPAIPTSELFFDIYDLVYDVMWFVYHGMNPEYYFLLDGIQVGRELYKSFVITHKYYERIRPQPKPETEFDTFEADREGEDDLLIVDALEDFFDSIITNDEAITSDQV